MSWNYTEWDEGNMGLGHLGPEPFRRGLRAVGLKHTFVVKKSWWPEAAGEDIQAMEDTKETEAVFRRKIVQSICAGMPVLAFGVVGPPEVSIITGYDEGGDVLIGWSCFQRDHPKDQFEPNGAFRQRNWFGKTPGLIVVEQGSGMPDLGRVYRDALEWAYQISTLPKTKTHLFGRPAYKNWAEAMLHEASFPPADEKTLQSRRYTVWDGLIMTAERENAAEFLTDIAAVRPDIAGHLREAARLFREEGQCGGRIAQALGGPTLPSKHLADPTARRTAADFILEARDRNAEALRHLASVFAHRPAGPAGLNAGPAGLPMGKNILALGNKAGGSAFNGKELKGLRPARRWMTLLGSLQGCLRCLGKDVDDAWLYGVTGAAFMLNIDENVYCSGPTSWGHARITAMAPRLGVTLEHVVQARTTDPDFEAKRKSACDFIKAKVDAGIPCFGFDGGWPEYFTVNGYNADGVAYWTHYADEGYLRRSWQEVGRNDTDSFEFVSVERVQGKADDRAVVREALAFALQVGRSEPGPEARSAQGLAGYDAWLLALATGDWRRKPDMPGVHHNVACWHECRCYAERFLRLAGEKIGGDLRPLFEKAADHYRAVRTALGDMQAIFIYKYPLPPVSEAGITRAIELLRTAKEEETQGLAVIETIVGRLSGGAQDDGRRGE
jgi:hypothetical protein